MFYPKGALCDVEACFNIMSKSAEPSSLTATTNDAADEGEFGRASSGIFRSAPKNMRL